MRITLVVERVADRTWRWRFEEDGGRTVAVSRGTFASHWDAQREAGDLAEAIRVVWPAIRVEPNSAGVFPAADLGV